ncbi:hypothetical protein BLOT_010693 [Blomia tropicalis]|nr:hypothetical protein BLOT_010693 [Blomia tropicalis]
MMNRIHLKLKFDQKYLILFVSSRCIFHINNDNTYNSTTVRKGKRIFFYNHLHNKINNTKKNYLQMRKNKDKI